MSDQSQNIFSLEISISLLTNNSDIGSFKPSEISFLSRAHNIFLSYYPSIHNKEEVPPLYEDFNYFIKNKDLNDLRAIINLLSRSSEGQEVQSKDNKEPELEASSIPPELETMVALYKEHQASLLETDNPHSVSEAIKRARKSWEEKRKLELIYENAEKNRQEETTKRNQERENFYNKTVNPKKESRKEANHNTYALTELAIKSQEGSNQLTKKQYNDAIEKLVYAAETGALEIDNNKQLDALSALVVSDETKLKTVYDELDNLVQEKQRIEELDLESEKIEELNSKINALSTKEEFNYNQSNKNFTSKLSSYYKDYDVVQEEAKDEIDRVIKNLGDAIPNAKLQIPQEDPFKKVGELESLIRKVDSSTLNLNSSGLGARVSGAGGNLAPVIDLYSKGLTKEKLQELTSKDSNEGHALKKFLEENRSLRKNIERGLTKVQNSPLGKELDSAYKKVNHFLDPLGSSRTYINKQIGKYTHDQIKKHLGEPVARKFEKYILSGGLKEGAKNFADNVAKKLIIAGAEKLGVKTAEVVAATSAKAAIVSAVSAFAGISTFGASLIVEAVLYVGWQTVKFGYNKFKEAYKSIWGEDFKPKEAIGAAALGGAAILGTFVAVNKGVRVFGTATKAAVISAAGIIWLSVATIAVFLSLTYLVAPILTTLVQFDSVEKVDYDELSKPSSNDCKWPIAGKWQVQEGPIGGTHSRSKLQAIDIFGPGDINGKPLLSSTDGVVEATGNYSNYGNSIKIKTTNTAGTFFVVYGHVSNISVKTGQKVKQGDKIGLVDSSELFTNPHIHMEYLDSNGGNTFDYNKCPAGGIKVKPGCISFLDCGSIMTN